MHSDDMDIVDGPSFVKAIRAIERGRGLLARIGAFIAVEEGMTISQYLSEAEAGKLVLIVHAVQTEVVERVRQTLADYGVRLMRHYERFAIRDLYLGAAI
jgi:hypothetical protein